MRFLAMCVIGLAVAAIAVDLCPGLTLPGSTTVMAQQAEPRVHSSRVSQPQSAHAAATVEDSATASDGPWWIAAEVAGAVVLVLVTAMVAHAMQTPFTRS